MENRMYTGFKHLHLASAILALLITLLWAVVAWRARPAAAGGLSRKDRIIYIVHRAMAGLAGLSGLGVSVVGPWRVMIFPYIGLAAFVVHGIAATISRRTFASEQYGRRRAALLIQIAALVFSAWLMNAKPF
jgi:hypothetical protein